MILLQSKHCHELNNTRPASQKLHLIRVLENCGRQRRGGAVTSKPLTPTHWAWPPKFDRMVGFKITWNSKQCYLKQCHALLKSFISCTCLTCNLQALGTFKILQPCHEYLPTCLPWTWCKIKWHYYYLLPSCHTPKSSDNHHQLHFLAASLVFSKPTFFAMESTAAHSILGVLVRPCLIV